MQRFNLIATLPTIRMIGNMETDVQRMFHNSEVVNLDLNPCSLDPESCFCVFLQLIHTTNLGGGHPGRACLIHEKAEAQGCSVTYLHSQRVYAGSRDQSDQEATHLTIRPSHRLSVDKLGPVMVRVKAGSSQTGQVWEMTMHSELNHCNY